MPTAAPAHGHPAPAPAAARLHTLLQAGRDFQGAPLTSFRMGRWDCKAVLRPLLAAEGITLDSSVCPLRVFDHAGPDHFLAPADPYWAEPATTPDGPARDALLISPITQIPILRPLARLWHWLGRGKRGRTISTSGAR